MVCREAFCSIYGVSKRVLAACSSIFKKTDSRRVDNLSVRAYNDSSILDFTYLQMQEIFESNVVNEDGDGLVYKHGKSKINLFRIVFIYIYCAIYLFYSNA